jgi:hypothetical protein
MYISYLFAESDFRHGSRFKVQGSRFKVQFNSIQFLPFKFSSIQFNSVQFSPIPFSSHIPEPVGGIKPIARPAFRRFFALAVQFLRFIPSSAEDCTPQFAAAVGEERTSSH